VTGWRRPGPPSGFGSRARGTFRRGERGQGIVEYGIILGMAAIVAILILTLFGDQVADLVQWLGRTIDAATGAG
jgi:Flp pilus assembly pilin Flp